jgi:hypothetical protein
MIPIERADRGMVVFLKCGCAAWRMMAHPTGAAFLVNIIERRCDFHTSVPERIWSIAKGELVSPFVRTLEKAS